MKKGLLTVFLLIFSAVSGLTAKNLAIMDLKADSIKVSEANLIRNSLESILVNTIGVKVIEREKMNKILKEQEIQISGITKDEETTRLGKILNVHYLMFSDISKVEGKLYLTIKAVSVENAKTLSMLQVSAGSIEDLIQEMEKKVPDQFKGLMTLDVFYPVFDEADKGITVKKIKEGNPPSFQVSILKAEADDGIYFDISRVDIALFSSVRIKFSGNHLKNIGLFFYTDEEKDSGYVDLSAVTQNEPGLYTIDLIDFKLDKKEKWTGFGIYFSEKTEKSSFIIEELSILP